MEEKQKKKFRFRLTIGNKILGSFIVLILLFILVASIIFVNGNTIDNVVKSSKDNYRPSKDAINQFILLVTRSRMLITNWVYLQTNQEDKTALRQLQETDYPTLRKEIELLQQNWDPEQKLRMDTIFNHFDSLINLQRQSIMANLQTFENYEDPTVKFMAENSIESEVIPITNGLIEKLTKVAQKQNDLTAKSDDEVIGAIDRLKTRTIILGSVFLLIAIISGIYLALSITKPVNFLKSIVIKLGNGELVEEKQAKFNNDEIGDMALAMDALVNGLKATTLFAENIGNGNYQTDFKPLSQHDVLGNALINMRNNLAKVAEDDQKRNWATGGLAKFGEILRTNNNDLIKLADEIIGNLVKYLKANQGALYIIDDATDGEEPTMSMKACYAWDKKKFLNHQIHKGEGLAGQAWQEGDLVYLTEVPQNYIKITSGLGDANPTSVLIVPLKVNDQIFGVVEIASFSVFQDYEMEFVQKIAESIASTISSVKINAKTQHLLEESQEMTEQMRAQEEEMRQNMEELQATQEEMQRGQAEVEGTMKVINESMAVVEFDTEGVILKANHNFLDIMGYKQEEIAGEHHRIFVAKDERNSETYRNYWRELAAGRVYKGEFKRINKNGEEIWLQAAYSPVKNKAGVVTKVMEIAYDITMLKKNGRH
jgi:PAS domain S-box-containing protein